MSEGKLYKQIKSAMEHPKVDHYEKLEDIDFEVPVWSVEISKALNEAKDAYTELKNKSQQLENCVKTSPKDPEVNEKIIKGLIKRLQDIAEWFDTYFEGKDQTDIEIMPYVLYQDFDFEVKA